MARESVKYILEKEWEILQTLHKATFAILALFLFQRSVTYIRHNYESNKNALK